jgi:hypothetical protein
LSKQSYQSEYQDGGEPVVCHCYTDGKISEYCRHSHSKLGYNERDDRNGSKTEFRPERHRAGYGRDQEGQQRKNAMQFVNVSPLRPSQRKTGRTDFMLAGQVESLPEIAAR